MNRIIKNIVDIPFFVCYVCCDLLQAFYWPLALFTVSFTITVLFLVPLIATHPWISAALATPLTFLLFTFTQNEQNPEGELIAGSVCAHFRCPRTWKNGYYSFGSAWSVYLAVLCATLFGAGILPTLGMVLSPWVLAFIIVITRLDDLYYYLIDELRFWF